MKWVTIVPAYGRDYTSGKAVQKSWDDGEDWLIQDIGMSGYVNKNDDVPPGIIFHARYRKLERVHEIKRSARR